MCVGRREGERKVPRKLRLAMLPELYVVANGLVGGGRDEHRLV